MTPGSVSGCCINRCGRYPVSIDLSPEEGKKEPTFSSAQAWQPSTHGRAHSSFVPLNTTTAEVAVTTHYCGLQVAGRRPVVLYSRIIVPSSSTIGLLKYASAGPVKREKKKKEN